MKKLIGKILVVSAFVLIMFLAFVDGNVFGMSAGVATNSDLSLAKKQALEQKRELAKTYERTKTISVFALYLPYLAEMENTIPYFEKCGVVTNPPVLKNFIGNVNTRYGVDLYALEYLKQKGEIGGHNSMLKQKKIKKYMLCVASYGLILAQAFKNFGSGLSVGGAALSAETYDTTSNGFYNLIGSSLADAIGHQDKRLKTEYRHIKNEIENNKCVLYNKNFKCGGVYLNIESSPKLTWGGLDWYNPQADFAGNNDVITVGYNKSRTFGQTQTKDRAINWVDNNTNNIASDLINGLF